MSAVPGLVALGWDDGWADALGQLGDETLKPGRVSRVDRGVCGVMTGTAEVRIGLEPDVRIAVGDWVAIGPGLGAEDNLRIVAVLPRRCVFRRVQATGALPQIVAANIDAVFVCDALDGRLSLRHLERFLALAWQSGATPVVVVTKADSVPPTIARAAVEVIEGVAKGVDVVLVSSTTGQGLEALAPHLAPGHTVALLGLSGAGKSTLVNLLARSTVLATGEVRKDGTGRHTTTHRELVVLPDGGLLIDTPGMRALSVSGAESGVEQAFVDLEELSRRCQYTNCSHNGELGCAVAEAIASGGLDPERLDSWRRLRAEPRSPDHQQARQVVADRKQRKAAKVAQRRDRT